MMEIIPILDSNIRVECRMYYMYVSKWLKAAIIEIYGQLKESLLSVKIQLSTGNNTRGFISTCCSLVAKKTIEIKSKNVGTL